MAEKKEGVEITIWHYIAWIFIAFMLYFIFIWESPQERLEKKKENATKIEKSIELSGNNTTLPSNENEWQEKIAIRAEHVVQILKQKYNIDIIDKKDRHSYNNYY